LYRIARIANDVRVVSSGDPKRIARRYANKAIGRHVVRTAYRLISSLSSVPPLGVERVLLVPRSHPPTLDEVVQPSDKS
jgi:hypothetical protein